MASKKESITKYCNVGSIIRAPYPSFRDGSMSGSKSAIFAGRAVIATVSLDSVPPTVSCLWEDRTPCIISSMEKGKNSWIAPIFNQNDKLKSNNTSVSTTEEGEESDIPVSLLQPLLPFEQQQTHDENHNATAQQFKKCGDQLLRLYDYTAAVEMYEAALSRTCTVGLGDTIILNKKGCPVLAEIDYFGENQIDSDDVFQKITLLDVTYINEKSEEETVTLETQVLLIILSNDGVERLQERILLNLARCLLQLAKIDVLYGQLLARPEAYRKAAILACTLAITCSNFHDVQSNTIESDVTSNATTTEEKARILRSMAYMDRSGYYKHALLDLRKVLKINCNNQHANKLLKQLQNKESQKKKCDRKLAKDMCQWIESSGNLSHE